MTDASIPNPGASAAEKLFDGYLAQLHAGDAPSFEELCAAHPEQASELRRLKSDLDRLQAMIDRDPKARVRAPLGDALRARFGEGVDPEISLDKRPDSESGPSSELLRRLRVHAPSNVRYKLVGEVGRGGMGVVLKVWDEDLHRSLAMKVVLGKEYPNQRGSTPPVDSRVLGRFLEEAQITGQLDHPGIVPVHELGLASDGQVYFTMRLVKGEDLRQVFEHVGTEHQGWNETRALGVLLKVCEAMHYAHDKGVVHRDLKPSNVMVGKYGEVYVMDWGLARVVGHKERHDLRLRLGPPSTVYVETERGSDRERTPDSPLVTMDGDVVGTPAYMPPEQARGEIDKLGPHSDVYAVGAMLYQLLTKRMPFVPDGARVSAHTVLARVLEGPPKPIVAFAPRTAPELVAICERAMGREVSERYHDMQDLAGDLRAFLEGRVVRAYETGTWAETKKWTQRNKALAATLAGTMLVLIAASVYSSVQTGKANDATAREATARQESEEKNAALALATREAQANLYYAAVGGAQSALRLGEGENARRLLDSAPGDLRNWEWNYLDAISDTSLLRLVGSKGQYSPDGTSIATIARDHVVRIWDSVSGAELARCEGHESYVWFASFSPDGSLLVTSARDETVRVWDVATGRELTRLQCPSDPTLSRFSPDGSRIVTPQSHTDANSSVVWDPLTGNELLRLRGHTDRIMSAAFSPDGSRVVTSSNDMTARVWSASNGRELARLSGQQQLTTAEFSPDGSRVVSVSRKRTARIWDAASGMELLTLSDPDTLLTDASFSPDGNRMLTWSWIQGLVRVRDAANGTLLARIDNDGTIHVNFSQDASQVVITSNLAGSVTLFDSTTGKMFVSFAGVVGTSIYPSFSPDGTSVIAGSYKEDVTRTWDTPSWEKSTLIESVAPFGAFSPDGLRIVGRLANGLTRVCDVMSGTVLAELGDLPEWEWAFFSSDGKRLVTVGSEKLVVWDAASGQEAVLIDGFVGSDNVLSFSLDASRVVARMDDNSARVFDLASGKEVARLLGHTDSILTASFSTDGSRIVTGSVDKTARVWDLTSGTELLRLDHHETAVQAVCFSPDGSRLFTGEDNAQGHLWESITGKSTARVAPFEGDTGEVHAIFSPDGSRLLSWTTSIPCLIQVLDVTSGRVLHRLEGHGGIMNTACFSFDGSRIMTGSDDKTVRIWDSHTGRELARLDAVSHINCVQSSPDGTCIVASGYARPMVSSTIRFYDSVPIRARATDRRARQAAQASAQGIVEETILRSTDFVDAGSRIRENKSLDPLQRRAALDVLGQRAHVAHKRVREERAGRPTRRWLTRLLGGEQWPIELDVEAALAIEPGLPSDSFLLNALARPLVDPDLPPSGEEVRALILARRAIAGATPGNVPECRDTLARALYRLGRFDEAVREQSLALSEASAANKDKFQGLLRRLSADIGQWVDASGALRRTEIKNRLTAIDLEVSGLEKNPDVRLWIAGERR